MPCEDKKNDAFFGGNFGSCPSKKTKKVIIRFYAPVSFFVSKRVWHETQKLEQIDDITCELTFDVGITQELIRWILGFGSNVEVIKPKSLRENIITEARELIEFYESKKSAA